MSFSPVGPYDTYSGLITPLGNINRAEEIHPEEDRSQDKKKYVEQLVSYPNRSEMREWGLGSLEFEKVLYKLPLEILTTLHKHLRPIFNDTFTNAVREDMISSLLNVDSIEWEDILQQACFIIANARKGHDIAWAANILCCSIKTPELRELVVDTANHLFHYKFDSGIRVRIFASVANLSFHELKIINENHKDASVLVQKVISDYSIEIGKKV